MKDKIYAVITVTVIATLLIGCSKQPPKCSDDNTIKLVRQIILDQTKINNELSYGLTEKEIQESMKMEYPLPTAFDEKIKKYSCEAKVVAGVSYQLPITYTSQLDDKNQHVVSVSGILPTDLAMVKYGIMESVQKSRAAKSETPTQPQTTPTTSSIVGTWGNGDLVIKPTPTGYDVAIKVSVPEFGGCLGEIQGPGSLSGNTLTLTKKPDDDNQVCTITIKFVGDSANIDENNCNYYHGMNCSFNEGNLKKVK